MNLAGKALTKNTVVGVSVGTLCSIIIAVWVASGIGRPLFAADLNRIEEKIDGYQTSTAIQILNIRKSALKSELRHAKREVRDDPSDTEAADDVEEISDDIAELDAKINCYRTEGCEVEGAI